VKLVLASGSPRRRTLLESIGLNLEIRPMGVDETPQPGEDPVGYALRMAREKTGDCQEWVLAADTVVHRAGEIWGKPEGPKDAVRMLEVLSGGAHTVTTGVCVGPLDRRVLFSESTEVVFRDLAAGEIQAYVDSGDPLDKAGAYGIQGGAAGFVRQIQGSYTNVVGLPLAQVVEQLLSLGMPGFGEAP
jgi:septum formation protein